MFIIQKNSGDFYINGMVRGEGIQRYSAERPTMPGSQVIELYYITPEFFKALGSKKQNNKKHRKQKTLCYLAMFLDIN